MAVNCEKCRFECADDDAFCRKCGASLAQEAHYTELPSEAIPLEVEAATVEVITPSSPVAEVIPVSEKRMVTLSRKVGSKVTQALMSEQGKKLAQGAAALAVAVGVELVNQATQRRNRGLTGRDTRKSGLPAVSVPDAIMKVLEERNSITPHADNSSSLTEDVYIRERVYNRRTRKRN